MGSSSVEFKTKQHAVCITIPAQGHINPLFKLAKILHHKGFDITFVYIESDHPLLLRSQSEDAHKGLPSFRFETIPDGCSPSEDAKDGDLLIKSIANTCGDPFRKLLAKLNNTVSSKVSCIISDLFTGFSMDVAQELGIPGFIFSPLAAFEIFTNTKYKELVENGYLPLKGESDRINGYMDTLIEDIPGLEGMSLRDLSTLMITTNPQGYIVNFYFDGLVKLLKVSSGFIVNTFEELEHDALQALYSLGTPIYTVGPLHLLEKLEVSVGEKELNLELGSNPWKEDLKCLEWLDSQKPNSVLYINFGTTALITSDLLIEFAWGLSNSNQPFLWIVRLNLVNGENVVLPLEFLESTKDQGMVAEWSPQEKVLEHRSVGGFLTHSGWNSILESMTNGIPMVCWPSFADQFPNSWSCCTQWGVGMNINVVKRDVIERLVKELFNGTKGKEMKNKALHWKKLANDSVVKSSRNNLETFVNQLLLRGNQD